MLDTCYMFPPSNVEQRSICEGLGSPLIDVRDQAGGQRKIFLFLPLSWVGRVGRASGGDADLGWAVFSGAVSRAGLRGSREEREREEAKWIRQSEATAQREGDSEEHSPRPCRRRPEVQK